MTTIFNNPDNTKSNFPNVHGLFYADKSNLFEWFPFTGQQRNFDRGNIRVEYFIKDTLFTEHSGFINQ